MTGEDKTVTDADVAEKVDMDDGVASVIGNYDDVVAPDAEYGETLDDEFSTVRVGGDYLVGSDGETAHGESAVTTADIGRYGDFIIEEFSVEANVSKASKYIKLPRNFAKYLLSVLYIAVGVLCVSIPNLIEHSLPYIVGGIMGVGSIVQFIFAIVQKEYKHTESNKTASSLILMGLSVMIIIEHEWAHTFIPIVWGVFGLFEAAHAFNHALSRISRGMRPAYYLVKGVVELVVAFLLLYKPEEYGELHIIVFGVSLILDGIAAMPVIKNFVSRR